MPKPLKYLGYAIVFQEVPNETTLAFNLSGCPYHCDGCHSQYLWEYRGDNLLPNMVDIIKKYGSYITCICFMGGDQNMEELETALKTCRWMGYKTCLYTGCDEILKFSGILKYLDWIKIGRYINDGSEHTEHGVKLASSNQHLYKVSDIIEKDMI